MKLALLDKDSFQCVLDKEDQDYLGLTLESLCDGSYENINDLFNNILECAHENLGFDITNNKTVAYSKIEYKADKDSNGNIILIIHRSSMTPQEVLFNEFMRAAHEIQQKVQTQEDEINHGLEFESPICFSSNSLDAFIDLPIKFKIPIKNDLYKVEDNKQYILVLYRSGIMSLEEYYGLCAVLTEHLEQIKMEPLQLAYLDEHGTLLVKEDALQKLSMLK